jgi:hypothetical protein
MNWQICFRGDAILSHKPSLGVKQTFPRIWEWKLKTLRKQLVAAEPTGVSMDTTKQQTSPWIPLNYISGRAEND